MNSRIIRSTIVLCCLHLTAACAHRQQASVLPKGESAFEVIGLGRSEQEALQKAESEARYTCEHDERRLKVVESTTSYQGVDKDKEVTNQEVALAWATGRSRQSSDDYRVVMMIECM